MGKIINIEKDTFDMLPKIGIFAGSLLFAAVAVYFYSPVIGSHADESEMAKVSIDVESVASLTTDVSEIVFDILPTSDGTFSSKPIVATVSTNSTAGYELYFSSEDNSTDMVHADSSVSDVIASNFVGTKSKNTMGENEWGYSLDNVSFWKIPTLATHAIIQNLDHLPSAAEKSKTVYIGTKVSTSLTSGSYSKNVKFSVVAHETPKPTVFGIKYMQEMTPEICAAATTPAVSAAAFDWDGSYHGNNNYIPRQSLKDSRDGKDYLVSKLADGNCWMSQSLALDLTSGTPIIASNNDGTTMSVTPNHTTNTHVSWDYDDVWRSRRPDDAQSYYRAGTDPSSSPSGEGAAYDWEKSGNIYNWYAATAGTGTSTMRLGEEGTASICPKGWRLPTSTGAKSYKNLVGTIYGLTSSEAGSLSLRANPLNFNLSGAFGVNNGTIVDQGKRGTYWTSISYTSAGGARTLGFSKTSISMPDISGTTKRSGASVRCVAI